MIRTRARTAIWQVVNETNIERVIQEFKKRMMFKKFGLRLPAYHYM